MGEDTTEYLDNAHVPVENPFDVEAKKREGDAGVKCN